MIRVIIYNLGSLFASIYLLLVLGILAFIWLDYSDGGLSDGLVIIPILALTLPWGDIVLKYLDDKTNFGIVLLMFFFAGLLNAIIIYFIGLFFTMIWRYCVGKHRPMF